MGKIEKAVVFILILIMIIMLGWIIWQNYQIIKFLGEVEIYKCLKDLSSP